MTRIRETLTQSSIVEDAKSFLTLHELLDLTGDFMEDVPMPKPSPGMRRLGSLTKNECEAYCLGYLCKEAAQYEIQASETTKMQTVVNTMRQERISFSLAISQYDAEHGGQFLDYTVLNKLSITQSHLAMMLEFAIRTRFAEFGQVNLYVTDGAVVYAKNRSDAEPYKAII